MEETAEKESDSNKIIVATLIVLVVLFAFTFYMAWNEIPTLDDMEEISWPTNGTATLLPVPDWAEVDEETGEITVVGKAETDSSDEFLYYVAITSEDEFNDYIQDCQNAGFIIDYDSGEVSLERYTKYYEAENEAGYSLSLQLYESSSSSRHYYGFIRIEVEAAGSI